MVMGPATEEQMPKKKAVQPEIKSVEDMNVAQRTKFANAIFESASHVVTKNLPTGFPNQKKDTEADLARQWNKTGRNDVNYVLQTGETGGETRKPVIKFENSREGEQQAKQFADEFAHALDQKLKNEAPDSKGQFKIYAEGPRVWIENTTVVDEGKKPMVLAKR